MTIRFSLVAMLLLSLTGCVAAIPLIAQGVSSGNMASQLCNVAKTPGQTGSWCDNISMGSFKQAFDKAPATPATTTTPAR